MEKLNLTSLECKMKYKHTWPHEITTESSTLLREKQTHCKGTFLLYVILCH